MISHGNIIFALAQIIVIAMAAPVITVNHYLIIDTHTNFQYRYQSTEVIPVMLAFLPLHHTYGLFVFCFRPTLGQGTLAILSKWDINAALRVIPKLVNFSLLHLFLWVFTSLLLYILFCVVLMNLFILIGTRSRFWHSFHRSYIN